MTVKWCKGQHQLLNSCVYVHGAPTATAVRHSQRPSVYTTCNISLLAHLCLLFVCFRWLPPPPLQQRRPPQLNRPLLSRLLLLLHQPQLRSQL
jgi:hypothetical protein